MEDSDKNKVIPIDKKVQSMVLAASLMKVKMTEKNCEVFIAVYEALCEEGSDITLSDIIQIQEDVEKGRKVRNEERKSFEAKKNGIKKGGTQKTYIEENIHRISNEAYGR